MNISLEEYGDFATSIGLIGTKTEDGAFMYKHKETGILIPPYDLGQLYRAFLEQYIKGIQDTVTNIEGYCMTKTMKKDELPKVLFDTISAQKHRIQSLENKIK